MTKNQMEKFAQVELFIRHVRNLAEIGPHRIRAEAVQINTVFEEALGKDYEKIFKTKTWKQT